MAQPQAQNADWEDDSLLRLYLTTLAGTVIQLQVPVSFHITYVENAGRVPGRTPAAQQPY